MSPIRPPSSRRCPVLASEHVASELRPALEPVCSRAHLRPADEPTPQRLGFVRRRLGLGRVARQQQPRAEEGQGRRHDQPAAPAPQLRRAAASPTSECCFQGGCERVDEGRDRQARQIDFPGLRHLQQPVERSLETVDRENRRRVRQSRARRILPGGNLRHESCRFACLPDDVVHDPPYVGRRSKRSPGQRSASAARARQGVQSADQKVTWMASCPAASPDRRRAS